MPKDKKIINKNDPTALKEAGNQAYLSGKFSEAVEYYTSAIELDDKNHIFYANRANANLEL